MASRDFSIHLQTKARRRHLIYNKLFDKYDKDFDDDLTFEFSDLPKQLNSESCLNKSVLTQKLSAKEKEIANKIEKELGSNLKELILTREKFKILNTNNELEEITIKVLEEIADLLKSVEGNDIEVYIGLCTFLDNDVINYIENTVRFKEALFRHLSTKSVPNHETFNDVRTEWQYLVNLLNEEDVIKYAIHILKSV